MTKEQDIIAEKLDSLNRKLEILTMVTAASIFQGKTNTEKISLLLETGLKPHEIGTILSIPQNSVRAIKSQLNKKVSGINPRKKDKNKSGKKNGTETV
jgi:hypothetical protein